MYGQKDNHWLERCESPASTACKTFLQACWTLTWCCEISYCAHPSPTPASLHHLQQSLSASPSMHNWCSLFNQTKWALHFDPPGSEPLRKHHKESDQFRLRYIECCALSTLYSGTGSPTYNFETLPFFVQESSDQAVSLGRILHFGVLMLRSNGVSSLIMTIKQLPSVRKTHLVHE